MRKLHPGSRICLNLSQKDSKERLERAGLADLVDFVEADAAEGVGTLAGPFDLVLIDVFAEAYIPVLEAVYPKLSNTAIVIGDNMTFPEFSVPEAERYRARIRELLGMEAILLPIGHGMDVARFARLA